MSSNSTIANITKAVVNATITNATKTATTTTTKVPPPEWMAWFTLTVIIFMIIGFVFQASIWEPFVVHAMLWLCTGMDGPGWEKVPKPGMGPQNF